MTLTDHRRTALAQAVVVAAALAGSLFNRYGSDEPAAGNIPPEVAAWIVELHGPDAGRGGGGDAAADGPAREAPAFVRHARARGRARSRVAAAAVAPLPAAALIALALLPARRREFFAGVAMGWAVLPLYLLPSAAGRRYMGVYYPLDGADPTVTHVLFFQTLTLLAAFAWAGAGEPRPAGADR